MLSRDKMKHGQAFRFARRSVPTSLAGGQQTPRRHLVLIIHSRISMKKEEKRCDRMLDLDTKPPFRGLPNPVTPRPMAAAYTNCAAFRISWYNASFSQRRRFFSDSISASVAD
jgi:hypothetical protein